MPNAMEAPLPGWTLHHLRPIVVPFVVIAHAGRRSTVMAATETIPVIDLGPYLAGEPGALDRTARELHFALTEIGFYFIVNHGVPREKIRAVFAEVKRFHDQPVEKKLALKIDKNSTGYL